MFVLNFDLNYVKFIPFIITNGVVSLLSTYSLFIKETRKFNANNSWGFAIELLCWMVFLLLGFLFHWLPFLGVGKLVLIKDLIFRDFENPAVVLFVGSLISIPSATLLLLNKKSQLLSVLHFSSILALFYPNPNLDILIVLLTMVNFKKFAYLGSTLILMTVKTYNPLYTGLFLYYSISFCEKHFSITGVARFHQPNITMIISLLSMIG